MPNQASATVDIVGYRETLCVDALKWVEELDGGLELKVPGQYNLGGIEIAQLFELSLQAKGEKGGFGCAKLWRSAEAHTRSNGIR